MSEVYNKSETQRETTRTIRDTPCQRCTMRVRQFERCTVSDKPCQRCTKRVRRSVRGAQ